jgi:hypothetical protein
MENTLPPVGPMTGMWVDFFIMVGVFALVATGALIWAFYFRKRRRKHRHKHRHKHDRHSINPTLAQTGGLPPPRPPESRDRTPSQTP